MIPVKKTALGDYVSVDSEILHKHPRQRCPSLNFLLEPEPSFFGFVFLGEPEPELFWFSFFRGSQSQSFFSFLFFGELEPELAKLDRPGSS